MNLPRQAERQPAVPAVLLRDASAAIYCQMYYWGRDVLHQSGNLLTAYGFTRLPKLTQKGTSRYRFSWDGGMIELHGFCAGWYPGGGEAGIVFHRSRSAWKLWREDQPPDPPLLEAILDGKHCPAGDKQELVQKSARLLSWICNYEAWALGQWGIRERHAHYAAYQKLRPRRWWLKPELSLKWIGQFATDPFSAPRPKSLLTEASPRLANRPISRTAA